LLTESPQNDWKVHEDAESICTVTDLYKKEYWYSSKPELVHDTGAIKDGENTKVNVNKKVATDRGGKWLVLDGMNIQSTENVIKLILGFEVWTMSNFWRMW
jgi:hypothetical protein